MSTPKTLTVTECHQLLDALLPKEATHKQHIRGVRNYTIALLMLEAGLRVGEVVQLKMLDLYYGDLPVENLTVRSAIAKNKRERIVPLSSRVRSALEELYKECPWMADDIATASVFAIWPRRKPVTTRQVERIICAAAMKSIGRPIHPHILRHTFATRVERKAGIRITQELLGHKNLASTQIYTHPNQDDLKNAIRGIGEVTTEEIQPGMQKFSPDRSADRIDTT